MMTKQGKLSEIQRRVLRHLCKATRELGLHDFPFRCAYTTINALENKGLVAVRRATEEYSALRRGAYGRWIGGTRLQTTVSFSISITEAGREAVRD